MRTLLALTFASVAAFAALPAYRGQLSGAAAQYGIAVATDGTTLVVGGQMAVDFYYWTGTDWKIKSHVPTPALVLGVALYKGSVLAKYANGVLAFENPVGAGWSLTQNIGLADGTGVYGSSIVSIYANTAAVGAPNYNGGRGQVYLLSRTTAGGAWNPVQVISTAASGADNFGNSVSLGMSGTTTYLLAGAPMYKAAIGNVYAYTQKGVTFNPAGSILTPASGVARFGQTLAGDTANVLVGAPANLNFAGSAHLYSINFNSGVIAATQTAMITYPGSQFFATAMALTSSFAVIAGNGNLIYFPFANGAIGGPNPLPVPVHSSSWANSVSITSNGFVIAGDPGVNSNAGAVSWYK
jgi:hypothetical protein